ncbi:Crp/Fnr family transcriptional regulator [Listeria booriae]|uniref:Crp/Fnr family transcriptional regulator n=1 Tax=Listeria booriae TaxID=1552123 RepID=UPI0016243F3D|nr:Crp/Fnr family transcriptional regulator [Listeria booriae]MBC2306396.1 Crp/Fnr family transcriptional regulator [Listeria booriae]
MEFLELQRYMHGVEGILSYIQYSIPHREETLSKKECIQLDNQIAIIKSGCLIEKTFLNNTVDVVVAGDFLFGVVYGEGEEKNLIYEAHVETELLLFDTETVCAYLEDKKLLSNFLFYVCEKLHGKLNYLVMISRLNSEERTWEIFNKLVSEDGWLPVWLNKKLTSELSRSSIRTTNVILNRFAEQKIIDITGRPWQVKSQNFNY